MGCSYRWQTIYCLKPQLHRSDEDSTLVRLGAATQLGRFSRKSKKNALEKQGHCKEQLQMGTWSTTGLVLLPDFRKAALENIQRNYLHQRCI